MTTRINYLVPIDFTPVTENALIFTLDLATYNKGNIILLHIISSSSERIAAEQKLSDLAAKHQKNGVEIHTRVVVGKVLKDIGVIAESIGVELIVMGTHGTSIWDKIFGSPAMSVVSNSNVPIILTQQDTVFSKIKTIVMTIDLSKESVQVVRYAAKAAKIFNAKLIMVGKKFADPIFMKKIKINMTVATNFLQDAGLEAKIHLLDEANFEKKVIAYCKEVNAGLLAATYYSDNFHLFSSNIVQGLAENKFGIPVMTFDGEDTSSASQFGFITQ
ncbi:MAG TPA: universal stress protein [Fluviicola sp.]|nr:universal stress protein [Fluviicola sp.]